LKECCISNDVMKNIYKEIGLKVKKMREKKGLSQLDLSLAIGHKSVGTVSMAEICINNKHFNIEHLYKIADILEVNVCELISTNKYPLP